MKKYISVFVLVIVFLALGTGSSKAVLQSNGNTPATYNVDNWMLNIRKMEELGGAMGLEETINSDLTSTTPNGIDVHMQKNTEYGAMAILSASSYGNPDKIENGETTTGNVTGVVMNLNKEWVAAGTLSSSNVYRNAVGRYKNVYNYSYVAKNGDAIEETKGWHGSETSTWLYSYFYERMNKQYHDRTYLYSGLLRSYSESIFDYYGHGRFWGAYVEHMSPEFDTRNDAYFDKEWASRAVVVVGEGI